MEKANLNHYITFLDIVEHCTLKHDKYEKFVDTHYLTFFACVVVKNFWYQYHSFFIMEIANYLVINARNNSLNSVII